uniref:Serine aminopeptidase S33 domain-containing protein n=1 Tax=Paramoeba aestuarina TaxID=180227 RepID=A0A6U2XCH7_9EUKA
MEDLGSQTFRIGPKRFERTDFELENPRGQKLQCSHYQPSKESRPRATLPCVVYMHGNAGCRLGALHLLPLVLPYDITLFTFDFSGCGMSEGEYISLGHFEKDDVVAVIDYLRKSESVSRIALWGRSMGAATAILFGATDPSIAALVLDSPFSSLNKVALELVEMSEVKVPKLLVTGLMKMIKSRIKERAKFDIEKLEPIESAPCCFIPALFVHGNSDNFILPHHSQDIQKKYAGDSNLILVEGDHNSERPSFCVDSITIFLHNTLLVGDDKFDAEGFQPGFGGVVEEDGGMPLPPKKGSGPSFGFANGPTEDELIQQAIALSLAPGNQNGGDGGDRGDRGDGGDGGDGGGGSEPK